jgi:hypothetical protein
MALPTVNDVQAIEPILTNMLVGYMQSDERFVASKVFPVVPVDKDSGTFYKFTKKYWFLDQMAQRAPGGDFRRVEFGLETDTYATKQWALDQALADEVRANSQVPMDLETAAVSYLAQQSLLRKEIAFSADFMQKSVWGTDDDNAVTDWDSFSDSDPIANVLLARRTISNNTGLDGNAMVMGYIVHAALMNHPDLLDRIKYTQAATVGSMENALAACFGVSSYLVGKAVYSNTNEAAAFSATAILDDDCLVYHNNPGAGIFAASAGKTFAWAGGGGVGSSYRYRDNSRHADVIQVKEQWDQKAVATDLGYFFFDVV